jgi:PAS domain S-box-containing protein
MSERPAATILFVDDDAGNRQTMGYFLGQAGYRVFEAATGEQTLSIASDPSGPRFDLVILDVNLPDINGFDVCRRLKSNIDTRSISVLHMSAVYVGSGDRSHGLEEGADGYLVKPVEPRELLATVQAVLRIRAAEEAARAAAQEWRTTFDAISDAVCLLDASGRIVRCNPALDELLQREAGELIDQPLDDVLRQGLGLDQTPRLVQPGDDQSRQNQELHLGKRWFRVTADPITDDRGGRTGSVYILTDITQRKELEEQIRQNQRLEGIGQLAGGIAHDFNNLLTAILGNSSLLLRALPQGEAEHAQAAAVERSAWRAAELTRQLLAFSRRTLLWLRPIAPGEIVDEVSESLRRTLDPRIELVVQRESDLWPVQADPGQLVEALMNLCLNAIEAMPRGGRLALEASNQRIDEAHASTHVEARTGPHVCISVHDTGEAIPPEVLDRVFDPYSSFTSKPAGRGSGLGLAMVHGLIKQHQGWIECSSTPESGNRFALYLPRTVAKSAVGAMIPSTTAAPSGTRQILLADDNDTLRALAAAYLRQGGFQVHLASDSTEALETYQREHARIDLVIIEQSIQPETGPETLRQLRSINPAVRALFASNHAEDARFRREEVLGIIPKPYRERELLQAVLKALEHA